MKTKRLLSLLLALIFAVSVCLPALAAEEGYKNVIIMIGDGMGENHLKMAEEYGNTLFMNTQCDLRGQSKTRSLSNLVTDSGAGGTAIACGMRVINQTIGVSAADPTGLFMTPVSIAEVAQERGMRTGVVTTDKTNGATPSDFSVHVLYRKMYEQIAKQQLTTKFDLIWGAKCGEVTKADAESHGFTWVENRDQLFKLQPGSRSYGQFSGSFWHSQLPQGSNAATLAEMTKKAITLLNTGNDKGFFLMVEGANIDSVSHRKDGKLRDWDSKRSDAVDAVLGFDAAVEAAVMFAKHDKHTIVVVTADHETGKVYFDDGRYRFHTCEHTNANVPLFVFGCDDLFTAGEAVDNYTIPIRITKKLGWGSDEFPRMQAGTLLKRLRSMLNAAA